jgi:hypothetical protein
MRDKKATQLRDVRRRALLTAALSLRVGAFRVSNARSAHFDA